MFLRIRQEVHVLSRKLISRCIPRCCELLEPCLNISLPGTSALRSFLRASFKSPASYCNSEDTLLAQHAPARLRLNLLGHRRWAFLAVGRIHPSSHLSGRRVQYVRHCALAFSQATLSDSIPPYIQRARGDSCARFGRGTDDG